MTQALRAVAVSRRCRSPAPLRRLPPRPYQPGNPP